VVRAIVVTALELEFRAVRAHLVECRDVTHRTGAVYTMGLLPKGFGRQPPKRLDAEIESWAETVLGWPENAKNHANQPLV
jgi:hypothetical protein